MGITHKKTLSLPDGIDPTDVQPSNWNDDHAITGDVDCASHKLVNLTDPASAQDAATKAYVDAHAGNTTIAAKTIAGNITGSPGSVVGLTDIQTRSLLNLPFISVKDAAYAAKGDGTTDDTAALQAALNAAVASGAELVLPVGTYKITSTVMVSGINVTIRGYAGTVINFPSQTQNGIQVNAGTSGLRISGISFTGANDDNKNTNNKTAILLIDGVTDTLVENCTFTQCHPLSSNDSFASRGLTFRNNTVHNGSGGLHPPSHSLIQGNRFICDTVLTTRGQAIYIFGQFVDITIDGNTFINISEEDIQIRSASPRWSTKHQFTITNNYFENSRAYSIWVGSDDFPNIGGFVIRGNRFRNVSSCIQAQGCESVIIDGNLAEWDFEFPLTAQVGNSAITVQGGTGQGGHWNNSLGAIVKGNRLIQRHPCFAIYTISHTPVDGQTVTVGDFIYTWKNTGGSDGQVQIPTGFPVDSSSNLRDCAAALVLAIQGADGVQSAMNSALRVITDGMNNLLGVLYGETDFNQVVVVSGNTFTVDTTATGGSWGAGVVIGKNSCGIPIAVNFTVGSIVEGNHMEDFPTAPQLTNNFHLDYRNNKVVQSIGGTSKLYVGTANIRPTYTGNTLVWRNALTSRQPKASIQCSDGFPVIEDAIGKVQLQPVSTMGRSGTVAIGDGKASALLYWGLEIGGDTSSTATLPWRWNDGDDVFLTDGTHNYTATFKRSSPGANQFNSASSLVTLINATAFWTASFEAVTDDFSLGNPNLYIRIKAVAGTAGNANQLWTERYEKPSSTNFAKAQRTSQPLGVALILRDLDTPNSYVPFCGGAATRVKTFVASPLANPNRPISVTGTDSTSQALAPIVYQADIIAGVGFTITHSVGAGTETFFWRVG